jgi:hypothetical protein
VHHKEHARILDVTFLVILRKKSEINSKDMGDAVTVSFYVQKMQSKSRVHGCAGCEQYSRKKGKRKKKKKRKRLTYN